MQIDRIATPERDILGEGPVWDTADGVLWWVDIVGKALRRYRPDTGAVHSWILPQAPGSLTPTESADVLLAVEAGFARFSPGTAILELIADAEPDLPHNRFNDGKCDRQGRFWAGSMDSREKGRTGSLYCLDADLSYRRVLDGLGIPNSLAWSPDSRTMYFAETLDRAIYAFDYDADTGTPSNRRVFAEVSGPGYPDGSTVDAEGCLWNAEFNGWRLVRYDPSGSIDRVVEVPVQSPTCCMFGGTGLDTLFVTTASRDVPPEGLATQPDAGGLVAIEGGVAGIPETRFAGRF